MPKQGPAHFGKREPEPASSIAEGNECAKELEVFEFYQL